MAAEYDVSLNFSIVECLYSVSIRSLATFKVA
jgi:hypothetical protein